MKKSAALVLLLLACLGVYWRLISPPQKNIPAGAKLERALVAGGCFWCMEEPFDRSPGVASAVSGYTRGESVAPNYATYQKGGHLEAVEILYDPALVSYEQLLDIFWSHIDPTDGGGQFTDRGAAYLSAIFYLNEEQKRQALESRRKRADLGLYDKAIATEILPAGDFFAAEEFHQDYYRKDPIRYRLYKLASGRYWLYWKTLILRKMKDG